MIDSDGGRIVNQSSSSAYIWGGDPYSLCKGAVNLLTLGLSTELAPHGITVNGIAPGPVPTDAMKEVVPQPILARIA